MALITNTWLKASVLKERSHAPVGVEMSLALDMHPLRRKSDPSIQLVLKRYDGDFKMLTLSVEEVRAILDFVLEHSAKGILAHTDAQQRALDGS